MANDDCGGACVTICHATIAHREVLNSVRSDQHVGVMTTQASLVSIAHTRDAKQIKSLASRLDAMRRNPKF